MTPNPRAALPCLAKVRPTCFTLPVPYPHYSRLRGRAQLLFRVAPNSWWFPVWFHGGQRSHSVWLSLFLKIWGLFYCPGYDLFCYMFCEYLERMHMLLWWSRLFSKCQWDPVGWWCGWVLVVLSVDERGIMTSSNIIVKLSISPFSFALHIFQPYVECLHI